MLCLECGALQPTGNRFCEDCGARLGAAPAVEAAPVPVNRDRLEVRLSAVLGGVSDRGKRHTRNDDFLALASGPAGDVLVVCDGVSSSQNPDLASAAAAEAAVAVLRGPGSSEEADRALMTAAIQAAQNAVADIPRPAWSQEEPPETTFVAAVRRGRRLTVGWLGDSRAYLFASGGARQLTEDHSWLAEAVAAGVLTREEALKSPLAHAVTRTVGGPTGAADEPSLLTLRLPDGPGVVLVCTDGLWNCITGLGQLAALVERRTGEALPLARALVDHARDRGGPDNITAAVLLLRKEEAEGRRTNNLRELSGNT
jgi:serine/threonine protein phosphatase PrpC